MTTADTPWFAIEAAYVSIVDLCVDIHATRLLEENQGAQAAQIKAFKQTKVSVADMSPPAVPAPDRPPLAIPPGTGPAKARQLRAEMRSKDQGFIEASAHSTTIELRDTIRSHLASLEKQLVVMLPSHDRFHVLLPLIIHIDEMIRAGSSYQERLTLDPFQHEFYGITNGGSLFFDRLREHLHQPQPPPLIVLEVFYFCLAEGFVGEHDDTQFLAQQRKDIVSHLDIRPLPPAPAPGVSPPVPPVRFPWAFYTASAAAVLATHGLLSLLAPSP